MLQQDGNNKGVKVNWYRWPWMHCRCCYFPVIISLCHDLHVMCALIHSSTEHLLEWHVWRSPFVCFDHKKLLCSNCFFSILQLKPVLGNYSGKWVLKALEKVSLDLKVTFSQIKSALEHANEFWLCTEYLAESIKQVIHYKVFLFALLLPLSTKKKKIKYNWC